MTADWRPGAQPETLRARARMLADIRAFFAAREVLEVDAPALCAAAATDPQLDSLGVSGGGYLHTSAEFGMKRLLAADSGPIYQLSHVFRAGERGRWHNPEFCMLEWYRPGWTAAELRTELGELLAALELPLPEQDIFADLFNRHLGLDPHRADAVELAECARRLGLAPRQESTDAQSRGFWLDLLMGMSLGPELGRQAPLLVLDFPACQAGLTRVRPGSPPVADRFELYWRGVELANGGAEETDPERLRRIFAADHTERRAAGRPLPRADRRLLAALEHGLPDCSGVAVGVDRLLALKLGHESLDPVLAFSAARA